MQTLAWSKRWKRGRDGGGLRRKASPRPRIRGMHTDMDGEGLRREPDHGSSASFAENRCRRMKPFRKPPNRLTSHRDLQTRLRANQGFWKETGESVRLMAWA